MKFIKYLPIVVCVAKALSKVAEDINAAKEDDGRVDAGEVLTIIDNAVSNIIKCVLNVVK